MAARGPGRGPYLGAALASRRSRPRSVASRRADISKAPEEVVPLEPNGSPPCPRLKSLHLIKREHERAKNTKTQTQGGHGLCFDSKIPLAADTRSCSASLLVALCWHPAVNRVPSSQTKRQRRRRRTGPSDRLRRGCWKCKELFRNKGQRSRC